METTTMVLYGDLFCLCDPIDTKGISQGEGRGSAPKALLVEERMALHTAAVAPRALKAPPGNSVMASAGLASVMAAFQSSPRL
jgi:hypothetical protein